MANRFKILREEVTEKRKDENHFAKIYTMDDLSKDFERLGYPISSSIIKKIESLKELENTKQKGVKIDWFILLAYKKRFNVSVDWLIDETVQTRQLAGNDAIASKTIGLSDNAIRCLKNYEDYEKEMLDKLINCNILDRKQDYLKMLLTALINYGMSAYASKITITDTLFNEKKEIKDSETINNMLKHSATEIFDHCLDISSSILSSKRNAIRENNLKIAESEHRALLEEIKKLTGKTESDILNEIRRNSDFTT